MKNIKHREALRFICSFAAIAIITAALYPAFSRSLSGFLGIEQPEKYLFQGFGSSAGDASEQAYAEKNGDGPAYIHIIDVGQGDSALLTDGETSVLIDAGPNASEDKLCAYLTDAGISDIDVMVLTHPHEDHIGGADAVLENFSVGEIITPDKSADKVGGVNAAWIDHNNLVVNACPEPLEVPVEQLSLQGKHNQLNSMAASLAAQILHIKNSVIRESLQQFAGVAHRLQYVATVRGVRFINDSKATNVNSCWYALESMTTPTVLILGGKDKGNDYTEIDQLVREKCHTLVFMGLHNEKLREHFGTFGLNIIDTDNLHDAVEGAFRAAREGDTVLLSPCCASFDLFRSYEDRGDQFMQAVRNL